MGAHCRSQKHCGPVQSVKSCAGCLSEGVCEVSLVSSVRRTEQQSRKVGGMPGLACSASPGTYVPARVNLARSHPVLLRRWRAAATRTGPAVELSVNCYFPFDIAELHPR